MTTLDLDRLVLTHGSHPAPSNPTSTPAACVMEAVAFFAGEPWSDRPRCASRVLTSFLIGLNDRWDDDDRQLLKPFIPRLVGTNTGAADEETRRLMILDWLVHEYAPAVFRTAGLVAVAEEFESMVSIADRDAWLSVRGRILEVRDEQWKRRRDAVKRAAVAVAAAAADAAAVAVAAAAADAAADAAAAAVAVADAAAAAAAVADAAAKFREATAAAVAVKGDGYSAQWQAAYAVLRPFYDERYRDVFAKVGGLRESVLALVDRLIDVGKAA